MIELHLKLIPEHAIKITRYYQELLAETDSKSFPINKPIKEVIKPIKKVVKSIANQNIEPELDNRDITAKSEHKAAPAPKGKTKPKMAAFGRSKEQVESYIKAEQERVESVNEELELKEQRRQERLARKAEKELEEKIKIEEKERALKEVEAIKATEKNTQETVQPKNVKPWEL
jgi:hypothetical protein